MRGLGPARAGSLLVGSLLLAAVLPAAAGVSRPDETARNRRIVTRFADLFYRQMDVPRAFGTFVAPDYVQHNPGLPDGREAAVRALTPKFADPAARFEVQRILVDGDLAVIHLRAQPSPRARGAAVADLYRLKGGRIVEHWDVIQPIPEVSANPHPMF